MWAVKLYYLCSGLSARLLGLHVPKATARVFMTEMRAVIFKCS